MKKLTLLILLSIVLFLTGCDSKTQKEANGEKGGMSDSMIYFKDKKTNLCFASIYSFSHGLANKVDSFTNVPCTPEVEKLLVNK